MYDGRLVSLIRGEYIQAVVQDVVLQDVVMLLLMWAFN